MTLPPPKCKCGEMCYVASIRVSGWFIETFSHDGSETEASDDSIVYGKQPKTVRCATCGKVYLNPKFGE